MHLFAEGMTGIPDIDAARVKMILVPRGLGKSGCVTQGRPLHNLLRNRNYATGIGNEKQGISDAFLAAIKQEFETNNLLRALFPETIPDMKSNKWSVDRIEVARDRPRPVSPSVLAAGVGSTVTGVHMDEWVLDDIISKNAADNARAGLFTEIDATNRWLTQLEPLLCSPKRDPITIIGTRWWMNDSYEWLEGTEDTPGIWGKGEKRRYFNWTLRLPDGQWQTIKVYRRGELAVFKRPAIENGKSIFPERYNLEELEDMQRADPAFFAGQYLLEPAGGGANEFKESDLRSYIFEGEQIRYLDQENKAQYIPTRSLHILISLDPAFSKKSDSARTAIPVIGLHGNDVFLLEDFAERGMGVHDMMNKVVDMAQRYGSPAKIFVETIAAQAALEEPLQLSLTSSGLPYVPIQTIPSHKGVAKGARIRSMERVFRTGHFYCRADQTKFKTEYLSFPHGGLVDILDALSFQVDEWVRFAQYGSYLSASNDSGGHVATDIARIRRNLTTRR